MDFCDVRVASGGIDQGVAPQGHPVDRLGGRAEQVLEEGAGAGVGVCGEEEFPAVGGAAPTHLLDVVPALRHIGRHLGKGWTGL